MTEPAAEPEPSAPSEPALPVAADRIEPSPPPEPGPLEPGPSEALISPPADAAAGLAFQRLAATVRPRPALTMEEHVTEMLRPMLRAWLDENLPPLVERLVQAEIERISRRG
jgi:cell pole-organizing protein PopZ